MKMEETTRRIESPVHPGGVLLREFLEPMGISRYKLAKDIDVPAPRVYEIINGRRSISADTALRLSRYFGLSDGYWINMQAHYDKELAKMQSGEEINRNVKPLAATAKSAD